MEIKVLIAYLLLFSITICFCSCSKEQGNQDETTEIVNQMIGDTLVLPKISKVLHNDSLYHQNITKAKGIKITTFIQGDCSLCIDDLKNWHELFQYTKSKMGVDMLFYLYSSDLEYFINNIYSQELYKYPLILDQNYEYSDNNSLPIDRKQYQTFLLDSNNKVVLVGNPVYNEKLKNLYIEEIEKRIAE